MRFAKLKLFHLADCRKYFVGRSGLQTPGFIVPLFTDSRLCAFGLEMGDECEANR
jgi:hypothetical protein